MYSNGSSEKEESQSQRNTSGRRSKTPGLQESDSEERSWEEEDRGSEEEETRSKDDRVAKASRMITRFTAISKDLWFSSLISEDFRWLLNTDKLSKEELMEEMQSAKRLDDVDPNLELNPKVITKFHKVRICDKTSQSWN